MRLILSWVRQWAHCLRHFHAPAGLFVHWYEPEALVCYDCDQVFYGTPELVRDLRRLLQTPR